MSLHRPLTQEQYDREELGTLERRLADVTNPGRQVLPSPSGREYRRSLEDEIERLRERLSDGSGV